MNRREFLATVPPAVALLTGCLKAGGVTENRIAVPAGSPDFALNIYGQLRNTPGNVFFSPLSISIALAMTAKGAVGPTLDEMAKVLHLPLGDDSAHAAYGTFLRDCAAASAGSTPELSIANAIWVRKDTRFTPEFTATAEKQYHAKIKSVDFAQKDALCKEINGWVAEQTRNKINEIIKPDQLDERTVAELLNAIYFKGEWKRKFDKDDTKEGDFHVAADKTVKVPFMRLAREEFEFAVRDDCSFLQMPYKGGNLAMMFVLPPPKKSLDDLEKSLKAETLKEWASAMKAAKPVVSIPKFKIECTAALAPVLTALGMPTAFDERKADFSRMTKDTELYISDVVHKAVVEVSEEGTEAAAATRVEMKERTGMPKMFVADRPFLFLIRDTKTGGILFMGRVSNPSA